MKHTTSQKGFTMVEMIVVLGIFALVSGTVLFNYSKFRSDTLLVNTAYEVALSIREAQIYGVSVRSQGSSSFSNAYGIYIPSSLVSSNEYLLFNDTDPDKVFTGISCSSSAECVSSYKLGGNVTFGNVVNVTNCSPITGGLSILFKRPNPEPIINNDSTNISQVQITLLSEQQDSRRYIRVTNNGQVSVSNQPLCQ